jgi:ACS family sodium-dependent inorganic phosphate cotransporter-like MFS transporter 5
LSFQIFGGFFAAKIGTKFTLALSVIISSVTTLLIPFAADSFGNYRLLIILRVFTGLAQGLIYPATLPFIIKWSTKSEKSILWSIITAGSCLGILLSTVLSGPVCSMGYWELNFIISGTLILFKF